MSEKQERIGEFRFRNIGGNHIAIYPHPDVHTNSFIAMTCAAVTKYIDVPYLHRIIKLVVIHVTSAYVKSTDAMELKLELEAGRSIFSKKFSDLLFHETDINVSEFIEMFGEEFEYEPRTWTLTLTSTNTDLVMPVLYIQKVGAMREGGGF